MASKSKAEEEEGKIPVFTVLKNNTILKNIFIVNKPPSPSMPASRISHEDVLMVGRHPDCDLMLTHPSISRFHLEIRSKPSSQSLFVQDLSSVHGTWVSGKKVEAGVSVEMKEGDTLKIGVSSRVYRLHWVPINRAYDMENPFLSQLEAVPEEEQPPEQEEQEEEEQVGLSHCCTFPFQSVDSILESISSLFLDEDFEITKANEILASSSPVLEDIVSSDFEEDMKKSQCSDETFGISSSAVEDKLGDSIIEFHSPHYVESVAKCDDTGMATDILSAGVVPETNCQHIKVEEVSVDSLPNGEKQDSCGEDEIVEEDIGDKYTAGICFTSLQVEPVTPPMSSEAVRSIRNENKTLQSNVETFGSCKEAMAKKSTNSNIWSRRGKASNAPQIRTRASASRSKSCVDTEVVMRKKDHFSLLDGEEDNDDDEVHTPDKENFSPNTLQLLCSAKMGMFEEVKSSKSQRLQNSIELLSLSSSQEWKKDLFSVLDGEKEEFFTPDKENLSPNTRQLHLLAKKSILGETKCSKAQCSQNSENMIPSSHEENEAPKVAQEHKSQRKPFGNLELTQCSKNSNRKIKATSKKVSQEPKSQRKPFGIHVELPKDTMALNNRVERVPFQILMDAAGTTSPVSAAKGIDVSNDGRIFDEHTSHSDVIWDQKRSWDMVVDTATLMDKESRNALQLLQGLKGTRLIVPRLVLRELESKKRQYSIFKRISEASLALEWIEECMVKTRWWIHVQSSIEEERLIAPTPPASPHTQFRTFPTGIMEIASPTAEDQILDFALAYKRRQNDGQLVLLSEDVTLKIKSMAEGLLCEPAQEFRASLVNPFSDRFLWTNSSPRGQTWSCQDDHVLREKYYGLPVMRKSSKGAASGLKLILLHNSQYRK
ncbi:hypothetical protein PIB30_077813 [Stylosanthes scabra]|uniref:FHA domain-containing protein n=1 Tax=Stylosanthes scabra TaxID=79078 RepID=A0ABU6RQP5_9FABA|nr:hypothetical protein [Stylosanthes scabra]